MKRARSKVNKSVMFFRSVGARKIRPWKSTQMEEDKMPAKALYLNTGDKTKSKYIPQKKHSSIEFGSKQFKSGFMWGDRV